MHFYNFSTTNLKTNYVKKFNSMMNRQNTLSQQTKPKSIC